ncbi:MAG: hypothetical protein WD059_12915 [Balneolaceae bacterium]
MPVFLLMNGLSNFFMMKFSFTYRFLASVLSMAILVGVSLPTGLHANLPEECDAMEMMHSEHAEHPDVDAAEDCPMTKSEKPKENHSAMHDLGFACACSIEMAPVKTEAKTQLKTKAPALQVIQLLTENHTPQPEMDAFQITILDAYSPPPIFLTNESFLN